MAGIALNAYRLRFAIDASNPITNGLPNNIINSAAIALPSGTALQFELLFYFQQLLDANFLDLTQYSQINIALCANQDPHSGTIYYSSQVVAADFGDPTLAEWQSNAANQAHITLFIPSAANVVPPGATNYWLVIWANSTDPAADNILLFAGKITGQDSGIPNALPDLSGLKVGSKLSFLCSDTLVRDVTLQKQPNGAWALAVNQAGYNGTGLAKISVYCPAASGGDNQFRDLTLIEENGQWTLGVNQAGHS